MRVLWALIVAIALFGLPPSPATAAEGLTWQPCGAGQECAWLAVPLDHANPEAGSINLKVVRINARSERPIGSLVVNPGGPGGSGADFVRSLALSLPEDIRRSFDLVGFDPRGVGQSQPIQCLSDRDLARYLRTDSTPRTLREQQTFMRQAAAFGPGCLRDQPTLARNMQTWQTIADMEILRAALGDAQLNFLGFSYGTMLGAGYAEAYPDRVGRLVLDGAVDPTLDIMGVSKAQAAGFQRAITRFATDCASRSGCGLGSNRQAVLRNINALLAGLDHAPIPTQQALPLVQSQALTGIVTALYSPRAWPALRRALVQARNGDGTQLQILAEIGNDQIGPAEFGSNLFSAFITTTCLDSPAAPGRAGLASAARQWSRGTAVPEISRLLAWSNAPCTRWYQPGATPRQISSATAAPILIIGTRYDPATPYVWSVRLNAALPTSALVTFEGDGHTAFASGVKCVDAAVTRYLIDGIAEDRICR
jgi:pimeloyl-ACP methyl ester carboxylesterase